MRRLVREDHAADRQPGAGAHQQHLVAAPQAPLARGLDRLAGSVAATQLSRWSMVTTIGSAGQPKVCIARGPTRPGWCGASS
jgi:hypothetical protein